MNTVASVENQDTTPIRESDPDSRAADELAGLWSDGLIHSGHIEEASALRRLGCPPMLAVRIVCTVPDTLCEVTA